MTSPRHMRRLLQPILLDRYRDLLVRLGAEAARQDATIIASSPRHVVRYVPFEHVNADARLVVVGITPGPTQIAMAYEAVRSAATAGTRQVDILIEAKRAAAFGGPTMRPNLGRMLEAFGFPRLLGIGAAEDLWGDAAGLMHATSVVPHAAFEGDRPFAGSFDDVMASGPLREMFELHFVPSLAALRSDALYVALGRTPLAALDWCISRGLLRADQVLGAFAHPSTNGGSQVAVYLGEKGLDELSEKDPVRGRVSWLREASARMEASTRALGGVAGVQVVTVAPPRPDDAPLVALPPRRSPKDPSEVGWTARPIAPPWEAEAMEEAAVEAAGFMKVDGTKKVLVFRRAADGREVYLVRGTAKRKLIVHPGHATDADRALPGTGGVFEGFYHNANMSRFPRRRNKGAGEVHYGLGYAFPSGDGVTGFLKRFGGE